MKTAPHARPEAAREPSTSRGTCTIGEAAARTGVSRDTIRYYERIGLLPAAPRSDGGYRRYGADAIARILFVRTAAKFGFNLKELTGFLQARQQGRPPCRSVRAAGTRLLETMDRQIAELTQARATMASTLAEWDARLAATPEGVPAHLLETLR